MPNGPGDLEGFGPLPPRKGGGSGVVNVLLLVVAALAVAGVGAVLTITLGVDALVICALLALVPLTICIVGLRWVDRWDPEPRGALAFAFLWGAGASVAVTLLVGPTVTGILTVALDGTPGDVVGPVIQAPIVEEIAKGLGVLLLVLSRRSHFDGPVDGIVYAGTIGAGFAFTENILYFGAAITDPAGLGGLVTVFVMRGLFSPFAHVMFTAALGFVVGLAVARKGGGGSVLGAFLIGLVPAIAGHMLWNGGLVVLFTSFFQFYLLVQLPLFVLVLFGVLGLRRAERRLTYQRLNDYARAGWLTEQEVGLVASPKGRAQALGWARSYGAGALMKNFIRTGTRLAFIRQRSLAGHAVPQEKENELRLLNELTDTRNRMFAAAARRPYGP